MIDVEQKTTKSVAIRIMRMSKRLKYKAVATITNGTQVFKYSELNIINEKNVEFSLSIDELEKEFKESQLNCDINVELIDTQNQLVSLFHPTIHVPIWTRIGFDYSCTFTTLNGKGRFGPTRMKEYEGQCHYNDTKLEMRAKGKNESRLFAFVKRDKEKGKTASDAKATGMQLWTIPKTGIYKVACYGAKGGDDGYIPGGFGAKVGSIFKLFENDTVKIVCGQTGQHGRYGAAGGGGGGTYFVLYEIGNKNPTYKEKMIVNIPLCIAAGGHGATRLNMTAIDGLCETSENRNNYGGYKTDGRAGRGASFKEDFDIFKSYKTNENDYNKSNPKSFLNGAIGGKAYLGT